MIVMDLVSIVIFGIIILTFNVDSVSENSLLIILLKSDFFEWVFILNFFYILFRITFVIAEWLEANDHYIQAIIDMFIGLIQLLGTKVF